MSRLQKLSANRNRAVLFHHGTHSAFICECMDIQTKETFRTVLKIIPAIRQKPNLLAILRNALENRLWEDIYVETKHL